jgi:spore coat protein JB
MNRDELIKKISQYSFASWELHVYLDTHPSDVAAIMRMKKYRKKAAEYKDEYEKQYGPLTINGGSGETWLNDPWPWERRAD